MGGVSLHGEDQALVFGDPVVEFLDAVLDVGHRGVGFAFVAAIGTGIDEEINCFADGGEAPDGAGGLDDELGFIGGVSVEEISEKALGAVGEERGRGEVGGERCGILGRRSEHFFLGVKEQAFRKFLVSRAVD